MALFEFHIHNHVDADSINSKLDKLMALIDDLKTQVADLKQQTTDLQAAVDLEQQQIASLLETNAATVTALNQQIASLREQLANSPTPEALQEVITGLTEVKDSIATSKADLEGTVQ